MLRRYFLILLCIYIFFFCNSLDIFFSVGLPIFSSAHLSFIHFLLQFIYRSMSILFLIFFFPNLSLSIPYLSILYRSSPYLSIFSQTSPYLCLSLNYPFLIYQFIPCQPFLYLHIPPLPLLYLYIPILPFLYL